VASELEPESAASTTLHHRRSCLGSRTSTAKLFPMPQDEKLLRARLIINHQSPGLAKCQAPRLRVAEAEEDAAASEIANFLDRRATKLRTFHAAGRMQVGLTNPLWQFFELRVSLLKFPLSERRQIFARL
jgi:hypothetical protein